MRAGDEETRGLVEERTREILAVVAAGVALVPGRRRVRNLLLFAAAATAMLAPWYGRIIYYTGNPVFPYAGAVFGHGLPSMRTIGGSPDLMWTSELRAFTAMVRISLSSMAYAFMPAACAVARPSCSRSLPWTSVSISLCSFR